MNLSKQGETAPFSEAEETVPHAGLGHLVLLERPGPSRPICQPRVEVDLSRCARCAGSHFMANSKCQLPTGSFRVQKKAWEILGICEQIEKSK